MPVPFEEVWEALFSHLADPPDRGGLLFSHEVLAAAQSFDELQC